MLHRTPKFSSIEKALAILMAFNRHHNHEMGTGELSQTLGFHPATVSRILQILSRQSFLQYNTKTRKFSLGPSTFELGKTIFRSVTSNFLQIAMPYLIDLRESVGETVVLEVISGRSPVVTYIAQGRRSLSVGPNIGDHVALHASPGAKAILAFSGSKRINTLLRTKMQALTPKTITDREVLKRQLEEIREKGVAFCREEMAIGVNAMGVPIFDHENRPVAAVVIAGLASRLQCDPESGVAVALKKTARAISAQLFHEQSFAEKTRHARVRGFTKRTLTGE
jgi:IclR family transcriptional regulator, KDG regulon repressor